MDPFLPGVGPLEGRLTALRPSPARHHMAGPWTTTAQLAWCTGLAQSGGLRHEV
jgi:hypothetical protein